MLKDSPLSIFFLLLLLVVIPCTSFADGEVDCDTGTIAAVFWKNNDQAIRLYTKCIMSGRITGRSLAEAYHHRGRAWQSSGDEERAIADYFMAVRTSPDFAEPYFNRAIIYFAKGEYDSAIKDYSRFIKLNQSGSGVSAAAYAGRALAWGAKGDDEKALADLNAAIGLDSAHAGFYAQRGAVYHDKGDYEKAIADYTRTVMLNPINDAAFYNRGLVLSAQGDYPGGIADFSRAISLNPAFADAYAARGISKGEQGDHEGAISDLTNSIDISPDYAAAYLARGRAFFFIGAFAAAAEDFERATALESANLYSMLWLYLSAQRSGRDGRAELARRIKGRDTETWPGPVASLYLGRTTTAQIFARLAGAQAGRASVSNEGLCEGYFFVGEYYLLQGDSVRAKQMFDRAIETGAAELIEYKGARSELRRMRP